MPATSRPTLGLGETLDNQRIMKLVEEALRHSEAEREDFLKQACGSNAGDFEQAWHYVEWEQRMQGFLLDPLIKRDEAELKLAPDELLQERFRIVREVAQGGMGVVYEARDERLGRRIALKCAKAGFGNELPPEVRHATEVSHPNVCKIYEIHTTRIQQQVVDFITMEFLEGETLANRIKRGRIPLDQAVTIARQLAAGLAEAHHNGVIHGDIKSNNVVLTKSNDGAVRAVITDFGLARMQGAAKKGVWGTPGYMAPELWMGEPPSVASDIYALGIVFYEMATGEMPDRSHTSKANSETLKATPWLEVARQKAPRVSAYWDRILGRCLEPDPKKRYAGTDDLVKALEPRHQARNLLLGAGALAAVIATGVITYSNATAPAETVRLAVVRDGLPVPDDELGRLTGTKKIGFVSLGQGKLDGATHLLKVSTSERTDGTAVHAVLSDEQSQAVVKTWDAVYAPDEWRYVGQALAGVVSAGLHLTPLAENMRVNERAAGWYEKGREAIRKSWTLADGLEDMQKANAADADAAVVWAGLAEAEALMWRSTKDGTWLTKAREAERQSELRSLDTPAGHRAVAALERDAGNYENAEAQMLRAIEIEPTFAENYWQLAEVYRLTGQFDQQLRALKKAVELDPKSYKNQLSLGRFFLYEGRYKEAVARLLAAVKLEPTLSSARASLAEAYTDAGQFEKAVENLNALKNWGSDEHFQLGTILMYQNKDAEAIPELQAAINAGPNEAFWMQLSIAQKRLGLRAQSEESVRQGLSMVEHRLVETPKNADARAFLGYFCARLGQRDRAESETAQALKLGPRQLDVIWMATETYESLKEREKALAILRASAPLEMLEDLKRWPDVAELTADSRFIELTATEAGKKEQQP